MYKGEIKGYPKEVVELMLDRQKEAGHRRDVTVFERNIWAPAPTGFDHSKTCEGEDFWTEVCHKRFDIFFEKYPKKTKRCSHKGKLEGFPDEIVNLMIQRYCEQYEGDEIKSLKELEAGTEFGWGNTPEDHDFWSKIYKKDFDVFYEKYPNYIIDNKIKQDDRIIKKNEITDSKQGESRKGRVRIPSCSRQVAIGKSYIGYPKSSRIKKAKVEKGRLNKSIRCF